MRASHPASQAPARAPRGPLLGALVAVAGLGTVGLVVAAAHPALVLVPVLAAAAIWALLRLPLRTTGAALALVLLALDDHAEHFGQWRTPLATLADMLHERLSVAVNVPIPFTGMELVLAALLAVWLGRRYTGSQVDGRPEDQVPAAGAVGGLLALYLLGVLYAEVHGLARGQTVAVWKLRNLLHPIALSFLFLAAFQGPRDYRLIGKVVVAAAAVKAVLAIAVQRLAIAETGGKFATATSHGDSVLFAVAIFLLAIDLAERPGSRRGLRTLLLLPLLLVGARENGRRLIWVMVLMALATAYLLVEMRGWKRGLTRVAMMALPLVSLYAAIGWDSGNAVFAPVRILRSVADTSVDRSAYWREVENWNIAMSLRERPILGLGLDGEYTEFMPNDDVGFKEYKAYPHNSVLGLLLLFGVFGFTALWALLGGVVFLAVRSLRMAQSAEQRVAALGCVAAVVACHNLAWGDTGAHYPQYKVMSALALAVAARLSVVTGAWPTAWARRRRQGAEGAAM